MRNPIERWTPEETLAAVLLAFGLTVLSALWILTSDAALATTQTPSSAALEWIFSPTKAAQVVDDWHAHDKIPVAVAGTLIDSLALVPAYSTLLALVAFAAARGLTAAWSRRACAVGWMAWIAGAFDLAENAGILLQLWLRTHRLAPATATLAYAKWMLLAPCVVFVLGWIGFQTVRLAARQLGMSSVEA